MAFKLKTEKIEENKILISVAYYLYLLSFVIGWIFVFSFIHNNYGFIFSAALVLFIAVFMPVLFSPLAGFAFSLTHEFAHINFFKKNRFLNDLIGRFHSIIFSLNNLSLYREYHLSHHSENQNINDKEVFQIKFLIFGNKKTEKELIDRALKYTDKFHSKVQNFNKILGFFSHNKYVVKYFMRCNIATTYWLLFFTAPYMIFNRIINIRDNAKNLLPDILIISAFSSFLFYIDPSYFYGYMIYLYAVSTQFYLAALFNHNHRETVFYDLSTYDYNKAIYNIADVSYGKVTDHFSLNMSRYHVAHHVSPATPHHMLKGLNDSIAKDNKIIFFNENDILLEVLETESKNMKYEKGLIKRV